MENNDSRLNLRENLVSQATTLSVAVFVSICSWIVSFFKNFLATIASPPYLFLLQAFLIYLGFLILVLVCSRYITNAKISRQSTLQGIGNTPVLEFAFAEKWRKLAKLIRLIMLFLLIPFVFCYFYISSIEKQSCSLKSKILGISVTSFRAGEVGGISDGLSNFLNNDMIDSKVEVFRTLKVISDVSDFKNADTINNILGCRESGVIVSGSNSTSEKSFYCNIYLHNMVSPCYNVKVRNKVIPIRDPKLLELGSVNVQVDVIGNFVKGLVYAYRCDPKYAISVLDSIINNDGVQNCPKLLAYSYLVKGNVFARSSRIDSAVACYIKGLNLDRANEDLKENYNLLKAEVKAKSTNKRNIARSASLPISTSGSTEVKEKPKFVIVSNSLAAPIENSSDTSYFSYGLLSIGSNGISSDFSRIRINKIFTVKGKSYNFLIKERVPMQDDKDGTFSYNFKIDRDRSADFLDYRKLDLKKLKCDIWFMTKDNIIFPNPGYRVKLWLTFSDGSKILLPEKQIKFHSTQ